MSVTYHPNKDESYPVEILKYDLARYRVRVRVTNGVKPFKQHGYFNETSCSDTGWVSANKCMIEPSTVGERADLSKGSTREWFDSVKEINPDEGV